MKNSIYNQWYFMSLQIIDSKILKVILQGKKKTPPKNNCKISFDALVKSGLLNNSAYFDTLTVV